MNLAETQRQTLEEIDILEVETAQRFRRNPELGRAAQIRQTDSVLELRRKRPHKETLLQQHELKYFSNQYERDCSRANKNFESPELLLQIESLRDPNLKFESINKALTELESRFKSVPIQSATPLRLAFLMYLSAPEDGVKTVGSKKKFKRRYFLSSATSYLAEEVGESFGDLEMYGKVLGLQAYYEIYRSLFPSKLTYAEYLRSFSKFPNSNNSTDYLRYLESLLTYLKKMHVQCFPLKALPELGKARSKATEIEDGERNEQGEIFCKACDKYFAKESVYKGHLDGKKHKKNSLKQTTTLKVNLVTAQDLERDIEEMTKAMGPLLDATISDYERRAAFSDREKMLETLAVEGEESEFTAEDSTSEASEDNDDDDEFYSKDMPIGTDGTPIPLWLYKLQGLHRTYKCEICGNTSYKGRQQFTKHFTQSKHIRGLMCLGIGEMETPLFNSISSIAEAQALWKQIKKEKSAEEEDLDNVEIEDSEGNVMSHKDYVELKKQGLL